MSHLLHRPISSSLVRRARATIALFLLAALALPVPARAQDMMNNNGMMGSNGSSDEAPVDTSDVTPPVYMQGSRPLAMGQAQIALSEGTGGVFQNPAGIARAFMYAGEGTFAYTPDGAILSAAIIDSKTNPAVAAGAGISYYFNRGSGPDVSALDVRVPVAFPIVPERVLVGITGRYTRAEVGPTEVLNGFTLDAGALFRIIEGFHAGVSAKNLIDPCELPACQGYAPLLVGGGLSYTNGEFAVALDGEFDLNSSDEQTGLNIEVGGEYLIQGTIPIRLGYRRLELTDSNIITGGVGWRSKTAGIDLSYRQDLSRSEFDTLYLGVSIYR